MNNCEGGGTGRHSENDPRHAVGVVGGTLIERAVGQGSWRGRTYCRFESCPSHH